MSRVIKRLDGVRIQYPLGRKLWPTYTLRWVSPDATACICEPRTLSYAELCARADALAERLRRFGVRPREVVAVRLPRTESSLIALWRSCEQARPTWR